MTEAPEHERHDGFEEALQRLSVIVDGVVAQQCARHYRALTQEHQLTSRLAQAIEDEIRRTPVDGARIEVEAREFPDHGPGSLEKKVGADLYVSIVRHDDDGSVSKGMLVQSKWDSSLRRASERRTLREQARHMREQSREASYVWVYTPRGVAVVPAAIAERGFRGGRIFMEPRTVGELIADGVRCNAGDPGIGRSLDQPMVESLNAAMERMGVRAGLGLMVEPE